MWLQQIAGCIHKCIHYCSGYPDTNTSSEVYYHVTTGLSMQWYRAFQFPLNASPHPPPPPSWVYTRTQLTDLAFHKTDCTFTLNTCHCISSTVRPLSRVFQGKWNTLYQLAIAKCSKNNHNYRLPFVLVWPGAHHALLVWLILYDFIAVLRFHQPSMFCLFVYCALLISCLVDVRQWAAGMSLYKLIAFVQCILTQLSSWEPLPIYSY